MKIHKLLNVAIIAVASLSIISCTSTAKKIRKDMKLKSEAFLNSNSDYNIVSTNVYMYNVGENTNFLASKEIKDIASNYTMYRENAERNRREADNYRNSRSPEYSYNPNSYRIARNKEQEAIENDSLANIYKAQLQKIDYSKVSDTKGGIWVLYEIEYKEYLYKCFAGPYVKRYLYLYSDDGENQLSSQEVHFNEMIFRELLELTGTKYEFIRE